MTGRARRRIVLYPYVDLDRNGPHDLTSGRGAWEIVSSDDPGRPKGAGCDWAAGPATRRHPEAPPYRCFLSDLTGFEGLCRAGPARTPAARIPYPPKTVNRHALGRRHDSPRPSADRARPIWSIDDAGDAWLQSSRPPWDGAHCFSCPLGSAFERQDVARLRRQETTPRMRCRVAERVGFEPTEPCGSRALQARALDQTTLPLRTFAGSFPLDGRAIIACRYGLSAGRSSLQMARSMVET